MGIIRTVSEMEDLHFARNYARSNDLILGTVRDFPTTDQSLHWGYVGMLAEQFGK